MKKEKKRSALSKLMDYAGSFRILTYLSWVLASVSAVLTLMPFVYLWRIIREVIRVNPQFDQAVGITRNGWMAVIFALLAMLVNFAALMCSHVSAFRVAGNMKKALLSHIAKLPVGFADEMGSGRVRRVVMDSTAATETLLAHNLPDMSGAIATPVCLIVLLFLYDWKFGLACLIPVILGFAAMMQMAGPGMAEDMRQYQNALECMSNEAVEYIRGVPVVKTFGQTVFSFRRFKKSIDDYSEFCIHYTKTSRRPMILYTVLINSSFAFILALTIVLTGREGYTQDILLNFLFYVIFTPVIATTMNKVMFLSENMMQINDAMDRVESIMNLPTLEEAEEAKEPEGASVELSDVTFRYAKEAEPAVRHLSLRAKEGEIVAIVGPSGSGKTTAAGLISRFMDVEEGSVKIGGTDVREIPKERLMDTVSYVFQDNHLLKRSIAGNLKIAKPDATEAEMMEALERAQCMDIISRLPDGIHTKLGSKGTYLSGGEKQRIAIARAMLKNAPVLVLDEASAFADPECEVQVQKAFSEMAKGAGANAAEKRRTVIMIAHRLSTVRNADRIYVLDRGTVAEEGTHEELLARKGLYASMWQDYQKSVSWKVGETA